MSDVLFHIGRYAVSAGNAMSVVVLLLLALVLMP